MNRFLIALLLLSTSLCSQEFPSKADDITYDWLMNSANHTDHVAIFKKIFSKVKVKTFLEFGVGLSTKYFTDHCNKVVSVEFVTHGSGPETIKRYIDFYQDCYNWTPIVFFTGYQSDTGWAAYKYLGSNAVYKANSYQSANQRTYAPLDDFYILELNAFTKSLIKTRPIEVAFVDCSLYLRGDLVQVLFDKSPIIVGHATSIRYCGLVDDVYGYSHIQTPLNYEEIFIAHGSGCTVWIEKKEQYKELVEELKRYANSP